MIEILQAENMQKVDEFELIYLGINRIDEKWFVIFEHTINHLSFGYVCLPQPEHYFSCFTYFFLLFFFFFYRYLRLKRKRTVFKVWAIKDIREDLCATEIVGARFGDSSQSGPPKLWTFKQLELDGSNFRNG